MPNLNLLDYVVSQLKTNTGSWPRIAEETRVPYHTITKIAYRKTKDPGISKIQTLADYFRNAEEAEAENKKAA